MFVCKIWIFTVISNCSCQMNLQTLRNFPLHPFWSTKSLHVWIALHFIWQLLQLKGHAALCHCQAPLNKSEWQLPQPNTELRLFAFIYLCVRCLESNTSDQWDDCLPSRTTFSTKATASSWISVSVQGLGLAFIFIRKSHIRGFVIAPIHHKCIGLCDTSHCSS